MRKTLGKQFKRLEKNVRIIVVRVLRRFRHNPGYDLGNPRTANVASIPPKHRSTLSDIIRHLRTVPETIHTWSDTVHTMRT
jgi:hypothetical protein